MRSDKEKSRGLAQQGMGSEQVAPRAPCEREAGRPKDAAPAGLDRVHSLCVPSGACPVGTVYSIDVSTKESRHRHKNVHHKLLISRKKKMSTTCTPSKGEWLVE